jgi:hypothetical protein
MSMFLVCSGSGGEEEDEGLLKKNAVNDVDAHRHRGGNCRSH